VKKEEGESQANEDQTDDDLNKFRMNAILSDVLKDRDSHLRYLTGEGGGGGRQEGTSHAATQTTATPPAQSPISPILGSLLSNTDLMQHLHQQLNPPVTRPLPQHDGLHRAASLLMTTSNPPAIQMIQQNSPAANITNNDSNNVAQLVLLAKQLLPKGKPSSFRGITRRKKRWEAHVWRHGKQQYLGGYKEEEAAARAYDKAVIKIRGREGETNFPSSEYVEEMKRLRAEELTVDEFILVLREEAKKRSKQLKEEEEDRRIAMLKQLNEGDVLNDYLSGGQHPSASVLVGKRERSAGPSAQDHRVSSLNLNLAAAVASSQGLESLKQINTEAILDSYLEMTRKAKRQKREQEKAQAQSMARSLSMAQHQHHSSASVNVSDVLSSLLQQQQQQQQGGGGGASTSATATGTSPITPNLALGGMDPQQVMRQMLSAESLLLGQQQQSTNALILQALAQQQQQQSMATTSLAALVPSDKKVAVVSSSSPLSEHKVTLHTLPTVPEQSAVPSITPPSSDAGSITVSNPSNSDA